MENALNELGHELRVTFMALVVIRALLNCAVLDYFVMLNLTNSWWHVLPAIEFLCGVVAMLTVGARGHRFFFHPFYFIVKLKLFVNLVWLSMCSMAILFVDPARQDVYFFQGVYIRSQGGLAHHWIMHVCVLLAQLVMLLICYVMLQYLTDKKKKTPAPRVVNLVPPATDSLLVKSSNDPLVKV